MGDRVIYSYAETLKMTAVPERDCLPFGDSAICPSSTPVSLRTLMTNSRVASAVRMCSTSLPVADSAAPSARQATLSHIALGVEC